MDTRYSDENVASHDRQLMVAVPAVVLKDVKPQVKDFDVVAIDEAQFFPDGEQCKEGCTLVMEEQWEGRELRAETLALRLHHRYLLCLQTPFTAPRSSLPFPSFCSSSIPPPHVVVEFAEQCANEGKVVILAALDGDFRRKPFGRVLELIPMAEKVDKLTAVCTSCCRDASFTKRIVASTQIELIGGAESYRPVCRQCFIASQGPESVPASPARASSKASSGCGGSEEAGSASSAAGAASSVSSDMSRSSSVSITTASSASSDCRSEEGSGAASPLSAGLKEWELSLQTPAKKLPFDAEPLQTLPQTPAGDAAAVPAKQPVAGSSPMSF